MIDTPSLSEANYTTLREFVASINQNTEDVDGWDLLLV